MPYAKEKDQIVAQMQKEVRLIEMNLEAWACVKRDRKKAMQTPIKIRRSPAVDNILRSDDVYVLMVQTSVMQGSFKNAFSGVPRQV
jgi:hypothetical protein